MFDPWSMDRWMDSFRENETEMSILESWNIKSEQSYQDLGSKSLVFAIQFVNFVEEKSFFNQEQYGLNP